MPASSMELLLIYALVMTMAMARGSDGAWCVCKPELSDAALQKTLDYACGAGADCSSINQNGACYNPNTVKAHCSYAANSYYQRKGQAPLACDFSGTATLTPQDPSSNGCNYPASPSTAGASNNNGANTGVGAGAGAGAGAAAGSGTDSGMGNSTGAGIGSGVSPTPTTTTNPGSATPNIMTPPSSGTGIIGPSGNTFSTDNSNGGGVPAPQSGCLLLLIFLFMIMLEA